MLPHGLIVAYTPRANRRQHSFWSLALTANREEEARRHAKQVLDKASALASVQGITCIDERREGRAAEKMLKAAKQHRCDLTIIGSCGLRGVSRKIRGEAGHDVVLTAPLPVVMATSARLRSVGAEHGTARAGW
jgi:nucleotide-binding universal stress UspA family protein